MSKIIQSIQRSAEIFEHIVSQSGVGITELSQFVKLNKSTVFSIVKTLEHLGYIYKDDQTSKYYATFRIQTLAKINESKNSIVGFARPILQKYLKKYGETIHFGRSAIDTVVYLDKIESDKSIRIHSDIGGEMPLHTTSVGKAILAWRSVKELEEYSTRTKLQPLTSYSITNFQALCDELEIVRENGYSIDNEENMEGLFCIGVPIFNYENKPQYSISLALPKYRLPSLNFEQALSDLKNAAEEIANFFSPHLFA